MWVRVRDIAFEWKDAIDEQPVESNHCETELQKGGESDGVHERQQCRELDYRICSELSG